MSRLLVVCAVLAGCADDPPDDAGPFYRGKIPAGALPGTLVKSEEVESLAPSSRSYRVLYTSLDVYDRPILVSGLVTIPDGPEPPGGFDVVSWAHGTVGLTDACVPSNGFTGGHDLYAIADEIVAEGWIAVATDYEGLGTSGIHPYLVGTSEGRGVLDIVRAVSSIEGATTSGRFAIWGHSQGGHSALFAAELAATYAPELDLVGTVAAAPASNLFLIATVGAGFPASRAFVWQLFVGMDAAYDDLELSEVLNEGARSVVRRLLADGACNTEWTPATDAFGDDGLEQSVDTLPAWQARLEESEPGRTRLPEPLLIIQGTGDKTVPNILTSVLVEDQCALGTIVDYRLYDGESHGEATSLHMPEFRSFTRDRFEGVAAISNCPAP